jgi:acetyltransferase
VKKINLDKIFNPRSVAVIGASRQDGSVGYGLLKNLISGSTFPTKHATPFPGKIYAVNPNAQEILGIKCYPSIKEISDKIDLAIIAVPAKIVPQVVKACVEKRVGGLIIVSAGFAEVKEGKALQEEVVNILKNTEIPMIGPNCLGVIRPSAKLNASFAPAMPLKGNVAFVSQSGALVDSIIDWAIEDQYGFSTVISYGNKAIIDSADLLDWLKNDNETRAIALYVESISDGKKFMKIAKNVAKIKPVVVLKGGVTSEGNKAASSHTGALSTDSRLYEAAFKQSGVIQTESIEDLLDIAKALANQPSCKENGIVIVTNGGGAGVLCADKCEQLGIKLVEISQRAIKKLDASGKMHPAYSRRNPLDLVGDALPERYEVAIKTLIEEPNIYGLIVIQTLQTMTNPIEDAKIVINIHKDNPDKPIICVYMGGKYSKESRHLLEQNGIPDYNDLTKASRAMHALIKRGQWLKNTSA